MTLCVSFKHHWVYSLHGRSEDRVTYQRVCIANVCVRKEARGVEALHPHPKPSWYLFISVQWFQQMGVVSCHFLTAVPTWTLAWLDHPFSWRLRGPLAERALCPVCTQDLWPQWGMFTQLKSNSVGLSLSCTELTGSHLGHTIDQYQIYPGLSEVYRCIQQLKRKFLVLKLHIFELSTFILIVMPVVIF